MSKALPNSVAEKRRNFAAILPSFRQTKGAMTRMNIEKVVSVEITEAHLRSIIPM
jgi:hypothetical protein